MARAERGGACHACGQGMAAHILFLPWRRPSCSINPLSPARQRWQPLESHPAWCPHAGLLNPWTAQPGSSSWHGGGGSRWGRWRGDPLWLQLAKGRGQGFLMVIRIRHMFTGVLPLTSNIIIDTQAPPPAAVFAAAVFQKINGQSTRLSCMAPPHHQAQPRAKPPQHAASSCPAPPHPAVPPRGRAHAGRSSRQQHS